MPCAASENNSEARLALVKPDGLLFWQRLRKCDFKVDRKADQLESTRWRRPTRWARPALSQRKAVLLNLARDVCATGSTQRDLMASLGDRRGFLAKL